MKTLGSRSPKQKIKIENGFSCDTRMYSETKQKAYIGREKKKIEM